LVDLEKIKQLVRMMVDNDLVEVSLRDGEEEVSLKRPGHSDAPVTHAMPAPMMPAAALPPQPAEPATEPAATESKATAEDDGLVPIVSPMVGTFYHAPNPESPPFVETGSVVGADSVVCIVEAMKVFNEIKAEVTGTVERILVSNQDPVEYGQELFLVRPPA
jgi:acetyl-CoA carboxylase biotin carboxyl carrier protein